MNVDLSEVSVFESNELVLEKSLTFIFGRNGTGKSTLTNKLKEISDYETHIFDGFDGIVDENKSLNAVALGKENSIINKQIELAENEINDLKERIAEINTGLVPPENDTPNFWSRRDSAVKEWKALSDKLEAFYSSSAAYIKNLTNPQIASTSYNRNNFIRDIDNATLLTEDKVNSYKKTLKTDVKIAPDIVFPLCNLQEHVEKVNLLLSTTISKRITIARLDSNEKVLFAKEGLHLHKKGDFCAFCGNVISDDVFNELDSYFSEDAYNSFQNEIKVEIDTLKELITRIKAITVDPNAFYPDNYNLITEIKTQCYDCKEEHIAFIDKLIKALEEKQSQILSVLPAITLNLPNEFDELSRKYNELKEQNNSNDLSQQQATAKECLRLHNVKQKIDEFNYNSKKIQLELLAQNKEKAEQDFENEKRRIEGPGGLIEQINQKNSEITLLKKDTKDEKLLVEFINTRLKHSVSFELVFVPEENTNGYYKIKDSLTGDIRNIDKVSTGEKNIIAFLYFVGSLSAVGEMPNTKPRLIVFDDPMNSNDDVMQYIIIEELRILMKSIELPDQLIVLTHNKHFYINLRYQPFNSYKKYDYIRLISDGHKTRFVKINRAEEDFETSYDALWKELHLLYEYDSATPDILLNPIRRIVETFAKFNAINKSNFLNTVSGAEKLFNVNSHSIDDVEAELNGKTKKEIIQILCSCFDKNNCIEHFKSYWESVSINEQGEWIVE